jgi:hypothetical protein
MSPALCSYSDAPSCPFVLVSRFGRTDGYRYSAVAEYLGYHNFFITMVDSDGVQGLVREICVRADIQNLRLLTMVPETSP